MLKDYLTQMIEAAEAANIELLEAVTGCGLKDSNYYRWMNKTTTPSEKTARRIMQFISGL